MWQRFGIGIWKISGQTQFCFGVFVFTASFRTMTIADASKVHDAFSADFKSIILFLNTGIKDYKSKTEKLQKRLDVKIIKISPY